MMSEAHTADAPAASATPETLAALWSGAVTLWSCAGCGWALITQGQPPGICPGCLGAAPEPLDATPFGQPPELVVPFQITQSTFDSTVQTFGSGIPFAPYDLTAENLRDRQLRLYLPLWLVDSHVAGTWQAEAGYNYQVVSHQERYAGSGWQTQEIQETRVRWEPRVGRIKREYANIAAPAIEQYDSWRMALGEYDLATATAYQPADLQGCVVRLPDRPPSSAWTDAARGFRDSVTEDCRTAAGADAIRAFGWEPRFDGQRWTLLMLPLLVTYYHDDQGAPQRLLLHGQTGRIAGRRRASMRRASRLAQRIALIGAIVLLLGALLTLIARPLAVPALAPLGTLIIIAGGLALIGALLPLAQVALFNQGQAEK